MWVYSVSPFLCLKASFMMLFIRHLSKSCGMEVYRFEKSNTSIFHKVRTGAEFKSAFSTGNVGVTPHERLPPLMKTFNFSQAHQELCCC